MEKAEAEKMTVIKVRQVSMSVRLVTFYSSRCEMRRVHLPMPAGC